MSPIGPRVIGNDIGQKQALNPLRMFDPQDQSDTPARVVAYERGPLDPKTIEEAKDRFLLSQRERSNRSRRSE